MTVVLLSGIAFVLLLTALVIVHEFGHYVVSLWTKVNVEEFGFGLPPRAKTLFTWRGTLFSLNWIPFGGFVRLQGENSLDPMERDRHGSFASATITARLSILMAGVFMNLIVAFTLFTLGFWQWNWVPTYLNLDDLALGETRGEVTVEWGLYVSNVLEGATAKDANMPSGVILSAVDGYLVTNVDEVLNLQRGKSSVEYTVLHGDALNEKQILTVAVSDGKTGIALSRMALAIQGVSRGFTRGLMLATREAWTVTVGTVKGIGSLMTSIFTEHKIPKGIAGIVGIAQLTHNSLQEGFLVYLRLVALLSLSLAVLNVLPFPALDGGRAMFVLFEMVTGYPINRRLELVTNGAGIVFLMALMAAVTWNDIARIIFLS